MIVYHGSSQIITSPDVLHSVKQLDFGQGFYVTTQKVQAERWAKRKSIFQGTKTGYVSVFEMKDNMELSVIDFGDDLETWIDFVCDCRNGNNTYKDYDVIVGKVANDKVFRVVDMYKRGIWDKSRAIKEIRVYETYDQINFVTQKAIDSMLIYKDSFEVIL